MAGKKPKLNNLEMSPFPKTVNPMLATLTDKPFNSKDWIFEIKWDGYRVISKVKGRNITLTSRNQTSFDNKFPLIKNDLKAFKKNIVIDGEVVAIDKEGKPKFQLLQNYFKTGTGNIIYYIFDLLWYDGYNTKTLPVSERKDLLKSIIPETENIFYCSHIEENGIELFNKVKLNRLEGIIAKKCDSKYYENTRSKSWLKIKTVSSMEAIVCGYTEPRGSRKFFGALILGVYDKEKLTYIGHTGTGFNFSNQKSVYLLLQKYITNKSPFEKPHKPNAPVTWMKPKIVCEVKFSHLTDDGIMRHPVFMKIRKDKSPQEVTLKSQVINE